MDLLAADSPPGFCSAVRKVAAELKGDTERHYDRLRKKYRRLEKRGLLPKGGDVGRLERRSVELRNLYGQRNARIEKAKHALALIEKEAAALGIDPGADLAALGKELEYRKQTLDLIAQGPVDLAFETFLRMGIRDPAEAEAKYREALDERQEIVEKLEALSRIREQRYLIGAG